MRRCRKLRHCDGDAPACFKRRGNDVPREAQWRTRLRIIAATPASAGAPERSARGLMPEELAEIENERKGSEMSRTFSPPAAARRRQDDAPGAA